MTLTREEDVRIQALQLAAGLYHSTTDSRLVPRATNATELVEAAEIIATYIRKGEKPTPAE